MRVRMPGSGKLSPQRHGVLTGLCPLTLSTTLRNAVSKSFTVKQSQYLEAWCRKMMALFERVDDGIVCKLSSDARTMIRMYRAACRASDPGRQAFWHSRTCPSPI